MVCIFPVMLSAQVRFTWPTAKLDVATYTNVDDCIAAVIRVADSVRNMEQTLPDTMPLSGDGDWATRPLVPAAGAVAKRCGARLTSDNVSADNFIPAMSLLLMTNRDNDADALAKKRLSAIPMSAAKDKMYILDSLVNVYLAARPVRLEQADRVIAQIEKLGTQVPWLMLTRDYARVLRVARLVGDTARARAIAQKIVAQPEKLSEVERRGPDFKGLVGEVSLAILYLEHHRVRDSLLRSTEAYVDLAQAYWKKTLYGEKFGIPLGEQAPRIQADWWFPPTNNDTIRPRRGHITLISFLRSDCYENADCMNREVTMRRLAQRFPLLDITIVAGTHGTFGGNIRSPQEEAKLQVKLWREYYKIPATIAVENVPYWRLPDPDRRRIDQNEGNADRYRFGEKYVPASDILIDENGKIVYWGNLHRESEADYAELIDILIHRIQSGNH
jgi:hypothetical protein